MSLQGYLLDDLSELPVEMMHLDLVRKSFSIDSKLQPAIRLQDASTLNSVIKFMDTVDPHLHGLVLRLINESHIDDITKFVNGVANLTRNVSAYFLLAGAVSTTIGRRSF